MKNKLFKALSLCLLLSLLAGLSVQGYATAKPSIRGTRVLWIGTGKNAILLDNLPGDARSFKIASSNPAVIKVGKSSNDAFGMWMKPLKVGKAKITVSYKSAGKTRKIAATYQAKKYPNPFGWITVDGVEINLSKNKVVADVTGYTKKSVKVNFKLNTGWKAKSLTGMKFGKTNDAFTWKKNKAVAFGDAGTVVFSILLKNKKNNDEFEYLVMVSR